MRPGHADECLLAQKRRALAYLEPAVVTGEVAEVTGLVVKCLHMQAPLGTACRILTSSGRVIEAEVVAVIEDGILLMPFGESRGICRGDRVRTTAAEPTAPAAEELLGRVINGRGKLIDGGAPLRAACQVPLYRDPPPPMRRKPIRARFLTGVRMIDALFPCGQGQKMGIFSGSGVGKTVLLAMIARHAASPVNVVALVGERGREVLSFIRNELPPEVLRRSVVVATTSSEPALLRLRAAFLATAIAEYFRDQGADVLLLMDSLTRLATAQREVGLSVGEPPASKGYPPSLFALLPRLLERAGPAQAGSITGFYTLLVEGDDLSDPIADAVRSSLDGHLWLSRESAARGEYPAIDPSHSVSRLARDVAGDRQLEAAGILLSLLSRYRESETLITVGAYRPGTDLELDVAVRMMPEIKRFLKQDMNEKAAPEDWRKQLFELAERAKGQMSARAPQVVPGPEHLGLKPAGAGAASKGRPPFRPAWLTVGQAKRSGVARSASPGR